MNLLFIAFLTNSSLEMSPSPSLSTASLRKKSNISLKIQKVYRELEKDLVGGPDIGDTSSKKVFVFLYTSKSSHRNHGRWLFLYHHVWSMTLSMTSGYRGLTVRGIV